MSKSNGALIAELFSVKPSCCCPQCGKCRGPNPPCCCSCGKCFGQKVVPMYTPTWQWIPTTTWPSNDPWNRTTTICSAGSVSE